MWSSAMSGPPSADVLGCQVVSASASPWTAKYTLSSFWLLHITPILFPPKATTAEMSSAEVVVPETGSTKGVPQLVSLPVVRLTYTCRGLPWVQVAQS
jgi:hypothetical protein